MIWWIVGSIDESIETGYISLRDTFSNYAPYTTEKFSLETKNRFRPCYKSAATGKSNTVAEYLYNFRRRTDKRSSGR